jgi:hypothetical protein
MPSGVIPKPPARRPPPLPPRPIPKPPPAPAFAQTPPPLPPRPIPKPPPGPPPAHAFKKTPPPLPPRPPKLDEIPPPPELEEDIPPPPPEEDFVPPPPPGHRRSRAIADHDEVVAPPLPEPPPPSPQRDTMVDPALFSVLERYTKGKRNAAEKGFGRMFSTMPGAKAVAPTTAATPQQLNAAGHAIGLVSQIADVTAAIAALDVRSAGETDAHQEATGNRARAAVWEKSGVPVDLRPMKSGVLGAEISKNRAAFQDERLKARDIAEKKEDAVIKGLVTKERAEKASLPASDAGKAAGWTVMGVLSGIAPQAPSLETAIGVAAKANPIAYKAWSAGKDAGDPLVKAMNVTSGALGSGLSILQAVLQLQVAAVHAVSGGELADILKSNRDEDRARDIAIGGSSEIEAYKSAIAHGKSAAATLNAIGGALVLTPAGPILKIVGMAIGAAISVADMTKDSYQAGHAAEKELEALYHGDAEESAEYVLRYGAEHRAESLLRKARNMDESALEALAVYEISREDLLSNPDNTEFRAKIIKAQGVATKNVGTRVSDAVSGVTTPIAHYFSDEGYAMVQHYRADIAERNARAKDLMLYGEAAAGKGHNMTAVRAKAFFRRGDQVDDERKALLKILEIKKAKRNHGLDPKSLQLVEALLQPQSHYQRIKADAARKISNIKKYGPGGGIGRPFVPAP